MAVTPKANSAYCCLHTKQLLSSVLAENSPAQQELDTFGFLKAVKSPRNMGAFEILKTRREDGKGAPSVDGNVILELEGRARQCNPVGDTIPSLCDAQPLRNDDRQHFDVTLGKTKSTGFRLNKDEFRQLCIDYPERLAELSLEHIVDLLRAKNDDLIGSFIANLNGYANGDDSTPGGGTEQSLVLLGQYNGTIAPQPLGMFKLNQEYRKKGYRVPPIVVGGTTLDYWKFANPTFTGNVEGRDGQRLTSVETHVDYKLDTVIGDGNEHAISWIPGHTQLIEYRQFEPGTAFEEVKEDYTETTLSIDVDGITYEVDYTINYDKCNRVWDISFTDIYDLWCPPSEIFTANCGGQETKLNWLVECGDLTCDNYKC